MRAQTVAFQLALLGLGALTARCEPARATIGREAFRDRVYACFLGKSIGGTLGMPVEGRRETHNYTFYDPVPTEPAANDDLDLQLLWLKAVEERGPGLTARDLGEYWLKYVPVNWNEYGVGKANLRDGFPPPLSGHFRNERWRDSNGAWIRSEVWACLAPGCPGVAARYAYEDACVDHGAGEGTWAEVFMAALESAAFVESDRSRLIEIGLSYLPRSCAVTAALRAALKAREDGLSLMQAREAVVKATESTGWFMAPRNLAFVLLGWLYGEGDFGKSLCAAVNCGDDTDCTGATLGSLLGILGGTAAIPAPWREPVGEGIRNVAVAGFQPPATLGELADRVVEMAPVVLRHNGLAVTVLAADAPAVETRGLALEQADVASQLASRSPYRVDYSFDDLDATLDFRQDPVIGTGDRRVLHLLLANKLPASREVTVEWRLPAGVTAWPRTRELRLRAAGARPRRCAVELAAEDIRGGILRGTVSLPPTEPGGSAHVIAFSLAGRLSVHKSDVALAAKGARSSSDSELDREPGCTARAIDGVIATADDFEGKRWHAALSPHPHWIAVHLPSARRISGVVVHFADPAGHPVDFDGEASMDGATWKTLFRERGYVDPARYERALEGVELRHFRLVLRRSASDRWPDAAQISELELLEQ